MSFEKISQSSEIDPSEVNRVLAQIEIKRRMLSGYGNHDRSEFAVLDSAYRDLMAGDITPTQAEERINEMFDSKYDR